MSVLVIAGRLRRVLAPLSVWIVASVSFVATAAGAAGPVLTESARSVVAEQVVDSQVAQPYSAAARDARIRSRAAFGGLSPAQARETLVARHPSVVSRPGWLAFPSLSSLAAGRPIGRNMLRVDGGDRPDSIVVTSKPVAFRDRAGDLRRIDLGLERAGDELVARESPVGLALPDSLDQAITVGDGDRQFSIVLAFVSAPLAWDAQQRPVPVEATVDGDDLVLQVPHRDRDVAYPIVVDPTVLDTCWLFISLASGCHVDLWETSTDPKFAAGTPGWAYEGDSRFAPFAGPGYLGSGLYIRNLVNNFYTSPEAGDWYYRAPPGVRIYQALFANLSQDNASDNTSCLFVGVLSGTGNWEPDAPRTLCAQQTYDAAVHWAPTGNPYYRGGGTEANAAIFGAMAQRTGWSSYFMDHMGSVAIGLQEMNHGYLAPYISSPDFPDNWQTDPNRSITFHAGDVGLGIRTITFSSPENPAWQPIDADTGTSANKVYDWCTGGARLTCPKDVWLRLKIGNLSPGYSTIRATVTDIVGKNYTYQHAIGIQYHWASSQYGGPNGVIDTQAEVTGLVNAMAAGSASARQAVWDGLDQTSRDYYVNDLLSDARQARQGFGLNATEAATRSVFSDPTTHGTIAEYGAPMTNADWATVSDEGPPSWAYDGPPNPDVLASTYNVSTDDGAPGPDATGNVGCDPTTQTGCPDSATTMTDNGATPSDPVTDDLDAAAAVESSEDAMTAGARSGGFDRYGARADADAHALNSRSGLYSPFGDSDCTNFVSQAWHLGGGLPMKLGWRIRYMRGVGLGGRSATHSWTLVRDFVHYMVMFVRRPDSSPRTSPPSISPLKQPSLTPSSTTGERAMAGAISPSSSEPTPASTTSPSTAPIGASRSGTSHG